MSFEKPFSVEFFTITLSDINSNFVQRSIMVFHMLKENIEKFKILNPITIKTEIFEGVPETSEHSSFYTQNRSQKNKQSIIVKSLQSMLYLESKINIHYNLLYDVKSSKI